MDINILFEDETLVVIDKPTGMIVNRSETSGEETVQDWAEKAYGLQLIAQSKEPSAVSGEPSVFLQRSGIVHRLDKETSGCLIIAKTPEAFVELQRQFKAREIQKEYIALSHGRVEPNDGIIRVPLGRSRYDRQKFMVTPGGRISETGFQIMQAFKGPTLSTQGRTLSDDLHFTLLRLFPKTGRTHQIRVHLRYFGHPIVSDETYAGDDRAREDRLWCPRLFLHAEKIAFTHPTNQKRITMESPLPNDLSTALLFLSPV